MTTKKIINILLAAGVVVALAFLGVKLQTPKEFENNIVLANIDALLQNESNTEQGQGSLDTSYKRHDNKCSIYVGAYAEVKIFGLGFFKADGDGFIHVSGQVTCEAGGDMTCKPVECIEIYELVLDHIEKV